METITLSYKNITIKVNLLGGELKQFLLNNIHYLHQGDNIWHQSAPHLFPIVGRLKENTYLYDGNKYSLNGHGFIRDSLFSCIKKTTKTLIFKFSANDNTLAQYPFLFTYYIKYQIINGGLKTVITIKNNDTKMMPFNIGEHPGFHLYSPIKNYQVIFNKKESFISPTVDMVSKTLDFNMASHEFNHVKIIPLTAELFVNDAVINTNLKSHYVILKSNDYQLKYQFKGFKTFAIWTKPKGNYLCLEPWCGYADRIDASTNFLDKPQLIWLKPQQQRSFTTIFKILKELKS